MLRPIKAPQYEVSVTIVGAIIMLIVQSFTGNAFVAFSWILWVTSLALVITGYIDHACVEWKLSGDTQVVRMISNVALLLVCNLILYLTIPLLVTEVDVHDFSEVIKAIQKYVRIYRSYGWFIFTYTFFFGYTLLLSFLRLFLNIGYSIYWIVGEVQAAEDASTRRNA